MPGLIPSELGQLNKLSHFYLQHNSLNGIYFHNYQAVIFVYNDISILFGYNFFCTVTSGSIPSELGKLSILSSLQLNYNCLSGMYVECCFNY